MGGTSQKLIPKRGDREPTFAEWHAVLTSIVGEAPKVVQETIKYFLRTSESGRAYLEGAQRLRPALQIGKNLELDEVIATYDAKDAGSKLVAEPRCGTDPELFDEATADKNREPETPLGKELKRILSHLEKPGAWPDTKPMPDVDWADLISWHPAFRDIFP